MYISEIVNTDFGKPLLPCVIEQALHSLQGKRNSDATCERIEEEPLRLQGVVAVPDKIQSGLGKPHPRPGMAIRQHTLVAGNHRLDDRLRHLRAQATLRSQEPGSFLVQHSLPEAVWGVDDLRDRVASLAVGLDGLPKPRFLLQGWI